MAVTLYRAGDYATDTLTNVIYLWGLVGTPNNVSHLRVPFSTAGYQVTAAKTLYAIKIRVLGESAIAHMKIGYADNDVGLDTATARTNPVMAIGVDDTNKNGATFLCAASGTTGEGQMHGANFLWKLSIAAKFPFIRINSIGVPYTVQFWCIEV